MKKQSILVVMIAMMMIGLNIFSPLIGLVNAEDKTDVVGNVFELDYFKLDDTEVTEGQIITVEDETKIALRYKWHLLEGHGLMDGDWIEIDIPGAFTQNVNITGNLEPMDSTNTEVNVGEYVFDTATNKLRFAFNSGVEGRTINEGFVEMNLKFDLAYFEENVTQNIPFNDNLGKDVEITLVPKNPSSAISKIGNPDSQVDAKYIDWSIDLLNTETTAITDGDLHDIIPGGLVLDETNIVLTPLTIGYDGIARIGSGAPRILVATEFAYDPATKELVVPGIPMNPYSGYRISYQTTFDDLDVLEFTNNASYKRPGKEDIVAVATVSDLVRSAFIDKKGTSVTPNEINWTIDVNKSGNVISNAIIEDVLDDGVDLVDSSITIKRISLVDGVWVTDGDAVFTDENEFPVNLGPLAADEAYRIVYNTKFDYLGNYSKVNTIENKATLLDGTELLGEATANVPINRLPIISKTSIPNNDNTNNEITWIVEINEAKHNLNNILFSDVLPAGLVYKAGSLIIKDSGDVDVTNKYTPTFSGQNIDITFGDIGQNSYTIEYTTTITDFTVGREFVNGAGLTGDGINGSEDTTSTAKPADNSFSKSFVGIDYANKTMSWKLEVDPIKENITTLTITDTFPNDGLILLETGFKVTVGTTVLNTTDYSLDPHDKDNDGTSNYNEGFIFVLNALPLNQKMVIEYTTSFDPEKGIIENISSDQVYKNTAQFVGNTTNNKPFDVSDSAEKELDIAAWTSGKKIGRRFHNAGEERVPGWVSGSDRFVEWDVYTNYLQQDFGKGVRFEDTLQYEGKIVEDSIIIRIYDVSEDGTTSITANELSNTIYNAVLSNDDKTVTITFDKDNTFNYNQRYVVSFITEVPNLSETTYSNIATLTVDDKPYKYQATVDYEEGDKFLEKSEANARSGGKAYVDEVIEWEIALNESLSILTGTKFIDTMSTGLVLIESSIEIVEMVNGIEVVVNPANYVVSIVGNSLEADEETVMTITFNTEMSTKHIVRYNTLVVTDQGSISNSASFSGDSVKTSTVSTPQLSATNLSSAGGTSSFPVGSLTVNKKDKATQESIDSVFELYYLVNGSKKYVTDSAITTENGSHTFENLRYRTYYLHEVSAPQGYARMKQDKEIIINLGSIGQNRVLELDIENIETLILEKEAIIQDDKEFYQGVNEVIYYTLTATNTGEETLTEVLITDDKEGLFNITYDIVDALGDVVSEDVVNGEVTLEPTQSLVMRAEYLITQEDADVQVVNNDATVVGYDENNEELSAEDDAVVEGKYDPEITLEKHATVMVNTTQSKESIGEENIIEEVGEWITYSMIASNTGNITLHMVEITDDKVGLEDIAYYLLNSANEVISATVNGETTLKPGEKLMMSAMYQVTQEDINQGDVENSATVISYPDDPTDPGNPNEEEPIEDEDDETVPTEQVGEISLVKSASEVKTLNSLGTEIEYSFVVTNTGNTTLTNVFIEDDLVENLEYISINGAAVDLEDEFFVLHSSDVLVAKASYTITQEDIDRGAVINHAFTRGDDVNEDPVEDDDEVTTPLEQVKELSVSKTSVLKDSNEQVKKHFNSVGDMIYYTITVSNDGNTTANNVTIIESMQKDLINIKYTHYDTEGTITSVMNVDQFKDVVLLPNEKIVLTASYQIQQKDLDKGKVENGVRVTAEDEDGETLGDEEEFNDVSGLYTIEITKVDDQDLTLVLSGAVFTLTNSDTHQVWTVTTDQLGKAIVEDLEAGTYLLNEVTAPEGYELSDEIIEVVVGGEQSKVDITIENTKAVILPDTSDSVRFDLFSLILLSMGALLLMLTRKTKESY